jgi:hypothetical protein
MRCLTQSESQRAARRGGGARLPPRRARRSAAQLPGRSVRPGSAGPPSAGSVLATPAGGPSESVPTGSTGRVSSGLGSQAAPPSSVSDHGSTAGAAAGPITPPVPARRPPRPVPATSAPGLRPSGPARVRVPGPGGPTEESRLMRSLHQQVGSEGCLCARRWCVEAEPGAHTGGRVGRQVRCGRSQWGLWRRRARSRRRCRIDGVNPCECAAVCVNALLRQFDAKRRN